MDISAIGAKGLIRYTDGGILMYFSFSEPLTDGVPAEGGVEHDRQCLQQPDSDRLTRCRLHAQGASGTEGDNGGQRHWTNLTERSEV